MKESQEDTDADTTDDDDVSTDHVDSAADGSGCVEMWEMLSDKRRSDTDETTD